MKATRHSTGAKRAKEPARRPGRQESSRSESAMMGLTSPEAHARAEIAFAAGCELARFFEQLCTSTDFDFEAGDEPRPIPAAVMYAAARRGLQLADAITSALSDHSVELRELEAVIDEPEALRRARGAFAEAIGNASEAANG